MAVRIASALGASGFNPWAAGAVLVAGTLYGLFNRPPKPRSAFETTAGLRPARRRPEAAAQRVIGNARTGGLVLFEDDRGWRSGGDSATDTQRTRYLYMGRLLSEGGISAIDAAWLDGVRVPLANVAGSVGGRQQQSTRDAFAARRTALRVRQNALIPGSIDADGFIVQSVLDAADPVAQLLWDDLELEILSIDSSNVFGAQGFVTPDGYMRESGWVQDWDAAGTARSASAFRLTWSSGSGADVDPTQSEALMRASAKVSQWRDTHLVKDIGWALCEFRMWERALDDSDQTELVPFRANTVPDVELLVRGDSSIASAIAAHGANPCKGAKQYLMEDCDVPEANLVDFDAKAPICDQLVTIPAVSRTDAAEPTAQKPITGPQVLEAYYGSSLPSTAVQDRILAEWNAREAGPTNARPRYAANGIIDSSMERDDVLASFGACMGGHIVNVGPNWYARPGETRSSAMVIVTESPTSNQGLVIGDAVRWQPDIGAGQAPNRLTASIAQDRERGWESNSVPAAEDSTLVGRDGTYSQDIGGLDFVNDLLDARRLLHLYLRRDSYGLKRASWAMSVPRADHPAASLVPDDVVTLQADGEDLRMRLVSVRYGLGVVFVSAVESPADVFEPTFHLPTTSRDYTVQPPGASDLGLKADFEPVWRDGPGGHYLDLVLSLGPDVGSLRVDYSIIDARPPNDLVRLPATMFHYWINNVPESGDSLTVVAAFNQIEPVALPRLFSEEGDRFDIEIKLTGYSNQTLAVPIEIENEGNPTTKTVKGPGVPGGPVESPSRVVFDEVFRPGDPGTEVGGGYDPGLTITGLDSIPEDVSLLRWKWSNEPDSAYRPMSSGTRLNENYTILAVPLQEPRRWYFRIHNLYDVPAGVAGLHFKATVGTQARLVDDNATLRRVGQLDLRGPTGAPTQYPAGFAIQNGLGFLTTRPEDIVAARNFHPGGFFHVSLSTGATRFIGELQIPRSPGSSMMDNFEMGTLWPDTGVGRSNYVIGMGQRAVGEGVRPLVFASVNVTTGAVTELATVQGALAAGVSMRSPIAFARDQTLIFIRRAGTGQGANFSYRSVNLQTGVLGTEVTDVNVRSTGLLRGAASDFLDDSVLLLWSFAGASAGAFLGRYSIGDDAPFPVTHLAQLPAEARVVSNTRPYEALAKWGDSAYAIGGRYLYQIANLFEPSIGYSESSPLFIPLTKDVTPAQSNLLVTAKPTARGAFDGQMAWTVSLAE